MTYFLAFLEYIVVIGIVIFLLFHRVGIFAATPMEEINDLENAEGTKDSNNLEDATPDISQGKLNLNKSSNINHQDIDITSLEDLIDVSDMPEDIDDISGIQLSKLIPEQSSNSMDDLLNLALDKSRADSGAQGSQVDKLAGPRSRPRVKR